MLIHIILIKILSNIYKIQLFWQPVSSRDEIAYNYYLYKRSKYAVIIIVPRSLNLCFFIFLVCISRQSRLEACVLNEICCFD